MSEQKPKCPKCGSANLAVERRPNGDAKCIDCNWSGAYSECFKTMSESDFVQKSAYDALAERLREAEAALKFYADEKSWTTEVDFDGYCVNGVIASVDTEQLNEASFEHGGKRAREYFKKWGNK